MKTPEERAADTCFQSMYGHTTEFRAYIAAEIRVAVSEATAPLVDVARKTEAFLLEFGEPFSGDDYQLMQDVRKAIASAEASK
jgi:hypothetical protein